MLIVPIENKPDWSRPPLITLGLILINILVFLFYQGNDGKILDRAIGLYTNNALLETERPYYLDYLKTERFSDYVRLASLPSEQQEEPLLWSILYDRGFDRHLTDFWESGSQQDVAEPEKWREAREAFQQERNRLSSIAAGLTPAERKPWTFFTSMFLHGGVTHLLGNMAFLFLFGFTLEGALSRTTYLGMYLVSGLAANGLFVALNSDSYMPLIGASGAVSGLMGMYLALYRLRRIRFFYALFFYFGEFRAPAILILPLWLAKELHGHFFVDSNTAYWAHIGGLLAGAGLMLALPNSRQQFDNNQEAIEQDGDLTAGLKDVQLAVSDLNYNKARSIAYSLCQRHPDDLRSWRTLFDLLKTQPRQKAFHEVTFNTLKRFSQQNIPVDEWAPAMEDLLSEYTALAPSTPALTGNLCLALAGKFWRNGQYVKAEIFLKRAQDKNANPQATLGLLMEMQKHYQQTQQIHQAEQSALAIRLLQKAIQLQKATPPAAE